MIGIRDPLNEVPIFVAGHAGMVGSALVRQLVSTGHKKIQTATRESLDLKCRDCVFEYFSANKPQVVLLAAARVGGILANLEQPTEFISDNLQIQLNVMDAALAFRVPRLVFFGSSCIYPRNASEPIEEAQLLSGPLEVTNEAYAIAKIAGIKHLQSIRRQYGLPWFSVLPTNLYGPGDNYEERNSHVLAALIRRFVSAKAQNLPAVTNWGSGAPRREFLHVDDLAAAVHDLLTTYDSDMPVNIGSGEEYTIRELSELVRNEVAYQGEVYWDTSKPDGVMGKRLLTREFPTSHSVKESLPSLIADYKSRFLHQSPQ